MSEQLSVEITLSLVSELIEEQFPQWAHLPIKLVEPGGSDNRTFRLGKDMSIRLPSAEPYALQVEKEQKWLPILAPHLPFLIPEPLALGKPSKRYPFHWSLYRWIEGESALCFGTVDSPILGLQLAQFLKALHAIEAKGPEAGAHNYWRGGSLQVYDEETKSAISQLKGSIDTSSALAVWHAALSSTWDRKPLWVHGDFSAGNVLVNQNQLTAVIDFGCMGVGDPACDLVIAWTLLAGQARDVFRSHIDLDAATWSRARGWALWKALITLTRLKDIKHPDVIKQLYVINQLFSEHTVL